jgi:hypothetical protein
VASKTPKNNAAGNVTGLKSDTLSQEQLRANFGITAQQLAIDPELQKLFQDAWKGKWEKSLFDAELKQTDWYQRNAKPMREYLMAAANPDSADWIRKKSDALEAVRQSANTLGANFSDQQLSDFATQSMMYGWGEPGREDFLKRAMVEAQPEGQYGGDVAKNADNLKRMALVNGVQYDDAWFQGAGKSIATRLSDSTFWEQKILGEAASMFPVFKDQILSGSVSARDIASPYLKMMQDTLGLNADQVNVNDPLILGALTNYDEKGNPTAMNLGAFQQKLRNDPRWMETDAAQNKVTSVAGRVMEMFGLSGGGGL